MVRTRPSDEDYNEEEDEEKSSKPVNNLNSKEEDQIAIPVKQIPDYDAIQIENNINIKKILQILKKLN